MIRRLRPDAIRRLWRADVPAPADVINLIHTADARSYRRYGLLVAPALLTVGGRPLWMGRLERVMHGASPPDKLMIVRYPTHRRFLAMVLSPWWLAINPLRERGVMSFEAAMTHASVTASGLGRRPALLAVHHDTGDLAGLGSLVYASERTARLDEILDDLRPTDPNPPRRTRLACFAVDATEAEALAARARAAAGDCDIALYVRDAPIAILSPR